MRGRAALSFVGLQVGWFACVLGAARGVGWLGPLVVAAALLPHVHRQAARGRELLVLALAALAGFAIDSALLGGGVIHIAGSALAPPWLVALWPNFAAATADGGLLRSLRHRPFLAGLLGAAGGALAYDSGARLGPVTFGSPRAGSLVIIGLVWGVVVPSLFALRARVAAAAREPRRPAR